MNQRSLCVAKRTLCEAFGGDNLTALQGIAFLHVRQNAAVAFVLLFVAVVHTLAVNLQETIEFHHFSVGDELIGRVSVLNGYHGLLNLGIGHLTGSRTLPDEFVKLLFLSCALDFHVLHIGRTDGFVSLLRTLGRGVILAHLAIFLTPEFDNLLFAGVDAET